VRRVKWLAFICVVCIIFFGMDAAPVQGELIFPAPSQVLDRTAQWGMPSAVIEWEEDRLIEDGGEYSFTGRSPFPFTDLSVG